MVIVRSGFMVVLLTLVAAVDAQVVPDGLVSYYTLDQEHIQGTTVEDLVGDNHGTLVGAPASIPGHQGEGLDFHGNPDCVQLPSLIAIGEGGVTYETWFLKTNKVDWQYLIANKIDFHNNFFRLGFNQNTGQVRFYTEHENETNKAWVTDEDYGDGAWHHLVATRAGDQAKVYIDGSLVKEEIAMDGDIGGGETDWYLAQDGNQNGYLIGAMDEVRIYSRALTPEEVEKNFGAEGLAVRPRANTISLTWARIKIAKE